METAKINNANNFTKVWNLDFIVNIKIFPYTEMKKMIEGEIEKDFRRNQETVGITGKLYS
ncbi:MAG TPA: hypothetical protein PKY59_23875 [Pyrinomonadaceae bacterium]|nr:hypothetical protein [Pyrinomonadaceae bacterium]